MSGDVAGTERLYGLRDSETMYVDIGAAYETQIEPWLDADDDRRPRVIEEWTVHPPRYHLRSAQDVMDWLVECVAEEGDISEDGAEQFASAANVPAALAAAESLLDLLASGVTYRMGDQPVAEHTITWDDDDEPLLNGERLYARRTVAMPGGTS